MVRIVNNTIQCKEFSEVYFKYIELFCNRKHMHSHLGYMSLVECSLMHTTYIALKMC